MVDERRPMTGEEIRGMRGHLVETMVMQQAQIIATLRADLAKAVEGLEGALGGLGCRSDCEWLHPDGSKCDCGNRNRKIAAQATLKELSHD